MNVSNMGQILSTSNAQSGNNVPHQTSTKTKETSEEPSTSYQTIDMRNVSLNEINALIRSGVGGLLDVVPFIPPNIINQYGAEYAANLKVDFIGQIETSIEFNKSIGEDTAFLEKVLENIRNIDGTKIPQNKIDVTA